MEASQLSQFFCLEKTEFTEHSPRIVRGPLHNKGLQMSKDFEDASGLYPATYDTWSSWHEVNPANGLPMMPGGIDVHGNPYGTDYN